MLTKNLYVQVPAFYATQLRDKAYLVGGGLVPQEEACSTFWSGSGGPKTFLVGAFWVQKER